MTEESKSSHQKRLARPHNILRLQPHVLKEIHQRPIEIKIDEIRKKLNAIYQVNLKKAASEEKARSQSRKECEQTRHIIQLHNILNPRSEKENMLPLIKKENNKMLLLKDRRKHSNAESVVLKARTQVSENEDPPKQKSSSITKNQFTPPDIAHLNETKKSRVSSRVSAEKISCLKKSPKASQQYKELMKSFREAEELRKIIENQDQYKNDKKIDSFLSNRTRKNKKILSQPLICSEQLPEGSFLKSQKKTQALVLRKQIQIKCRGPKHHSIKLIQLTNTHKDFVSFIQLCNQFYCANPGPFSYYVGKGNNQDLIRRALKNRGWNETVIMEEANLVWTQRKVNSFLENLPALQFIKQPLKQIKLRTSFFFNRKNDRMDDSDCYWNKLVSEKFENFVFSEESPKLSNGQANKKIKRIKATFMKQNIYTIESRKIQIHNHFMNHHEIAYKQALFWNLKSYYEKKGVDPFENIPITFHVKNINDEQWNRFRACYEAREKESEFWIIKPAQNTNRGTGISVKETIEEIQQLIQEKQMEKPESTFIVQKYLMPFLYNRRKFDMRCYLMVCVVNRKFRAYWYEEGYARTSCKIFSIKNLKSKFIHLTNDAIQKNCEEYGKFQPGNKLSFDQLERYIEKGKNQFNFISDIYEKMVKLARDSIAATYTKLHNIQQSFCFEIFGMDFMIDDKGKVWLIEINKNPCLETTTSLLCKLISNMIDDAFRIVLDPLFPIDPSGRTGKLSSSEPFQSNKFRLIFQKNLPVQSKTEKG